MAEDEQEKVVIRAIIEILGKPKEHIESTIKDFVEKRIKTDTGIEIIKEDYEEAQPQDDMFSAFVELELKMDNVEKLMEFCFDNMPSSVEILEPDRLTIGANKLSGLLNDMQARIHSIDMALKTLKKENEILNNNSMALLRNNIILSLAENEKTAKEIAENVGLEEGKISNFLEIIEKQGYIVREGDKYKVNETAVKKKI